MSEAIEDLPGEEWRPVVGYEDCYEVSNFGRVKTIRRELPTSNGGTRVWPSILRKLTTSAWGYKQISLCLEGTRKCTGVHRLVAQAFVPNPENKAFVNHIDGNKENNTPNNLEWVTQSENEKHAHKFGLKRNDGEFHPGARLTEDDVREVWKLRGTHTKKQVADLFGVADSTISMIWSRKNWAYLAPPEAR